MTAWGVGMNFQVKSIRYTQQVRDFVIARHYTKTVPSAVRYCFGLYEGDRLMGVLLYSYFSRLQSAYRYNNYVELGRLCCDDECPANTGSFFIGATLRHIKRHHREIEGVISYADPTVGHLGTVYRASNFEEVGKTRPSYHWQGPDGPIHKKRIWDAAKKAGISEADHARALGLTKVPELPKYIFRFNFPRPLKELGCIYCATAPDGRRYVGQTINSLEYRRRRHRSDAKKSHLPFHEALREQGFDNFQWDVIEQVPRGQLSERERHWIAHHGTEDRTRGFNVEGAVNFTISIPDHELLEIFRLRQAGHNCVEIGERMGLNKDWVNCIIWGRDRPAVRALWLETNEDFKKSVVDDQSVLKIFELRAARKTTYAIADILGVSSTYVSKVLRGLLRPDAKAEWDLDGPPVNSDKPKLLTDQQAFDLLRRYHEDEIDTAKLAAEAGLSRDTCYQVLTGRIYRAAYDRFAAGRRLAIRPCRLTDQQLLRAFDLRFLDHRSIDDITGLLDVQSTYLGMLFKGEARAEVRRAWVDRHGEQPLQHKFKVENQRLRMADPSVRGAISRALQAAGGRTWPSVAACAAELGCSSTAVIKAIKRGKPVKGVAVSYV